MNYQISLLVIHMTNQLEKESDSELHFPVVSIERVDKRLVPFNRDYDLFFQHLANRHVERYVPLVVILPV